ncbi:MAG: bifunctional riboflavin kinase/FAD synthetase [Muribaculaceae bacterium]|nr:bifunctional riboflavin kinase/FAD synthetase [Muribaculaceae bacterium]
MSDKIIASIGTFDGVHRGHRFLLDQLRQLARDNGDATVMAVTFDRHPLALIAPERQPARLTPNDLKQRLLLEAGVDRVEIFEFDRQVKEMTAGEFMALLRDRYGVTRVLTGYDNSFGSDRPHGIEQYRHIAPDGVTVDVGLPLIINDIPVSSTRIRRALSEGNLADANLMLGRPYRVSGTVTHGQHLGHRLGFPTANLQIPPHTQVPKNGVYAATATVDSKSYPAMVNIGLRPTVEPSTGLSAPTPTIEAHIIDFAGDIYGASLSLDFIARLRDEQRFPSLDALTAQLNADRRATLHCIENWNLGLGISGKL